MTIEIKTIGERLKMYRNALNIPQGTLAENLHVAQNQISRFENGLGGSLEIFLLMLGFYSNHFLISYLFQNEFEIVQKSGASDDFHTIALEKLKDLETDVTTQIRGIIGIMENAN